jgi:DNA-directed RNA polymerase specialized sigma24 family protein
VIVLRYVADLREREVGAALGISEGAASAALVTARRRLARALDTTDEDTTDEREASAP